MHDVSESAEDCLSELLRVLEGIDGREQLQLRVSLVTYSLEVLFNDWEVLVRERGD